MSAEERISRRAWSFTSRPNPPILTFKSHRGVNDTRADGIDIDAVFGVFTSCRLGNTDDSVF